MNKLEERLGPVEKDILLEAIGAIERETDLRIRVIEQAPRGGDVAGYEDARLKIDGEEYHAEVKAWAQQAPLGVLIDRVRRFPTGILVADYVNPRMADRLRTEGVQFMDAAGNAYIRTPFHHVQIKGNRRRESETKGAGPRKHKGFTIAGLKVTYAFLCNPELVRAPYRDIAKVAGVALGTVTNVMDDLQAAGFLLITDNERRLVHADAVLETWVERYPAALRPKQGLGTFTAQGMDWWQNFPIEDFDGYWGGELAGAHYTGYLRPVVATAYVPRDQVNKLIAKARLRKQALPILEPGTVELLAPFWRPNRDFGLYVHPILAYADLIATDDPRNIEVARKLYDEKIAQRLG